ncbi:hypothetical protein M446_7052 (plasmid) [Methylobacterium sp. 4-46]|nr:hypothetical protein M446_7052 [Methylobacterium sp. 4-46]
MQGQVASSSELVPTAIFAGRQRLSEILDELSTDIRAVILHAALGRRGRRSTFRLRVDRARVTVAGDSWWIDPDAFPASSAQGSSPVRSSRRLAGCGLIGLLATLYGISHGTVVMRLLHALAPGAFDAQGWLEISAAAQASIERCRSGRDGAR